MLYLKHEVQQTPLAAQKPAAAGPPSAEQVGAIIGRKASVEVTLEIEGGPEMTIKAPRVLVVDDDAGARMLCAFHLQGEGLEVIEAADGRGGLTRARRENPDLVVTDVAMPGLDGFEFAEALRGEEGTARIPLIFLSGERGPDNEARAHALGALAYMTKPFDPADFVKLVTGVLDRLRPRSVTAD